MTSRSFTDTTLAHDPLWPRTGSWSKPDTTVAPAAMQQPNGQPSLAVIGIPTSITSLSPSRAHHTPAAIRQALRRYSSHLVTPGLPGARGNETELVLDEAITITDAGDLLDPDTEQGELQAISAVTELATHNDLVVALGGDNACTFSAALGVAAAHGGIEQLGLITLDAHHDLRDGRSNGSPVQRLIEAGLRPTRIVQIGIADFANSHAYRKRAKAYGITVIHRNELFDRKPPEVVAEALDIAGGAPGASGAIYVDLDLDVCDRSIAPACPASLPGGLHAHELRRFARMLATDSRVKGIDIAEVDAQADASDARTVRLAALLVLEAAAGLAARRQK